MIKRTEVLNDYYMLIFEFTEKCSIFPCHKLIEYDLMFFQIIIRNMFFFYFVLVITETIPKKDMRKNISENMEYV